MYSEPKYHPEFEQLVDVMVAQTSNPNRQFFRIQIIYFLGVVAAHMRINVQGWVNSNIPINIYAINIATSGAGKGYATYTLEQDVLAGFRENFLDNTFLVSAQQKLQEIAAKRAARNQTDIGDEQAKLDKEFNVLGSMLFSFDSATPAAVKQLRHKIMLANAGAINLQIDEIGANLVGQTDVLTMFLELYDQGLLKEKLIKSTQENQRTERLEGKTPSNMLLFGEPSSLLDGGATQEKFMEMLRMGYARRCYFGFVDRIEKDFELTPEEALDRMESGSNNQILDDLRQKFNSLSMFHNKGRSITLNRPEALKIASYKLHCERLAANYADHETIQRNELEHRYFKVLKLAGAYAFYDGSPFILPEHVDYAITLAEESGESFHKLINPEKPYIKFAKYLASHKKEVTYAELDSLSFWPKTKAAKDDLVQMACAWGYKNLHIIRRSQIDGITFFSGATIQETNLDQMIISHSADITENYHCAMQRWSDLPKLFAYPTKVLHWANHWFEDNYRLETKVIKGFNMLVMDFDGGATIAKIQGLLKNYTYYLYTTKSHQLIAGQDRFRLILPINYVLHLDTKDYNLMMKAVMNDMPLIKADESAFHRCKKWETHTAAKIYANQGELFDILPYIPKTTKDDERVKRINEQADFDNLERWVLKEAEVGNRNNLLFRYGSLLNDMGEKYSDITIKISQLNAKLDNPLEDSELHTTVYATLAKRMGI